jgi:hypothetical protein
MSKEVNQLAHEVLTEKQQAFADFIAKRVMPVAKPYRDTRNYYEANLTLDPKGQLVPVTEITLLKYKRVAIEGELDEETTSSETYPHMVWGATMKNDSLNISSSLYLTAHDGFTYAVDEYSNGSEVSDEFGKNIVDTLLAADEAGFITPA